MGFAKVGSVYPSGAGNREERGPNWGDSGASGESRTSREMAEDYRERVRGIVTSFNSSQEPLFGGLAGGRIASGF